MKNGDLCVEKWWCWGVGGDMYVNVFVSSFVCVCVGGGGYVCEYVCICCGMYTVV